MNKKYLLSSVTAGIALFYANQGTAQCLTKQDCAALGYTETSCSNGGIKCPFGNTWSCTPPCGTAYKYTCSGTGYAGGSGTVCGGKYSKCSCSSGYEWKDGSCKKEVINGPDGNFYKCNGRVVGVKTLDMNFYIAMGDLSKKGWDEAGGACYNYTFCNDLKGTLPNYDQLTTVYNNKSLINNLLTTNGGTKLSEDFYWSSAVSPYDSNYYLVNMANGYTDAFGEWGTYLNYVRPILTSW